MRSTVLILALIGCGNPELESENTDLKAKVEDLEKSEAKLKKKVESLKTKLATTERALTALQQAETYGKLGIEAGDALAVRFHTSLGKINCSLMPDVAPKTVLNFVQLAEGTKDWTDPKTKKAKTGPLYDGTIFHRVIPKFMIQGGDPMGWGAEAPATVSRTRPLRTWSLTRRGCSPWRTPGRTRTEASSSSRTARRLLT